MLQEIDPPEVGIVVVADGEELVEEHCEVGEVFVGGEARVELVAEGEVVAVKQPVEGAALGGVEGLLEHGFDI